jgi:hypothetical protein
MAGFASIELGWRAVFWRVNSCLFFPPWLLLTCLPTKDCALTPRGYVHICSPNARDAGVCNSEEESGQDE